MPGRAGLPVTIYRPMDIAGDHRTGVWNTSTEMCALIRFMTDTGVAPDIDLALDFVPADIFAAAMGHISHPARRLRPHLPPRRPGPRRARFPGRAGCAATASDQGRFRTGNGCTSCCGTRRGTRAIR